MSDIIDLVETGRVGMFGQKDEQAGSGKIYPVTKQGMSVRIVPVFDLGCVEPLIAIEPPTQIVMREVRRGTHDDWAT